MEGIITALVGKLKSIPEQIIEPSAAASFLEALPLAAKVNQAQPAKLLACTSNPSTQQCAPASRPGFCGSISTTVLVAMKTILVLAAYLLAHGTCACVPDFADKILSDPLILQYPAVIAAFKKVQQNLSSLYIDTTRDGLSFAVVCTKLALPKDRLLTYKRFMRQAQSQPTRSITER